MELFEGNPSLGQNLFARWLFVDAQVVLGSPTRFMRTSPAILKAKVK